MTLSTLSAKAAALAALSLTSATAFAQTVNLSDHSAFAMRKASSDISKRPLLLASAIVLFVGLVDDDTTLTVLGGVGVLVSTLDTGQSRYGLQLAGHDVGRAGILSFGVKPYREMGWATPRLAPYAQLSFKF